MEITGRLTADAMVSTTPGDKQVVNFTIAINDSYKPKGSSETKQLTTYIRCAYWLNAKATDWLKKGALVQVYGRIGMDVYNNMDGEAVGRLTFHTNGIKVLAFPKRQQGDTETAPAYNGQQNENSPSATDDLPF